MTKTMFHTVAAVAVVGVATAVFAPGHAAVVGGFVERAGTKIFGDTCAAAPADCLTKKGRQLEAVKADLTALQDKLDGERGRTNNVLGENRRLLSQNQVLLADAKRAFQAAPVGQPVTWAGVQYPNRDALADQVQSLWVEGESLGRLVAESETVAAELGEQRRRIVGQRVQIEASLRLLPAKIALVSARASSAEFDAATKAIDAILDTGKREQVAADNLMRSTQEVLRDQASRARPAGDTAFRAWLENGS
ncbi:hypothetical protein [Azospirillum griseum]|uniref:Uncharacterized protein n=1 Tax=Azospirillum griseum TaxID=2496639 RepID=A0A431VB66_9PROT|nr:hypothetical protein [Azospirillum griseum]RTR15672.1 hypothetical protein EJ903_22565 [Azospirillum griseum]